jgi:hypothetical protein
MDTLSHSLWGYGLFGFRGKPWLAVLFGALPDLLPYGWVMSGWILNGHFPFRAPPLEAFPDWVFVVYDFSHSFVVSGLILVALCYWRRDIAFAFLAWPFHIVLDFPFHTRYYFPTHIFWPISDFFVDGIPWNHPWVWYPNLAGILLLLVWRYVYRRRGSQANINHPADSRPE